MIETAVIVGVIIGLVQVIKIVGAPSQWAPLASVVLGVVFALAVTPAATIGLSVFNGILYGLMAAGLYSGVKTTVNG